MKEGKATLDLSKDEKQVLPATVDSLCAAVLELMPHARHADVFLEVEDWTGFCEDFVHLNERQQIAKRDPHTDLALFAAILAQGLNLPLTVMAESTEIPYHEMTHASDWYICEESIRRDLIERCWDDMHRLSA